MNAWQLDLDFEAADDASRAGEALVVALDGFEGPLHLLLALARGQKVDLLQISIADLAGQYLTFVERQRRRRFGLAAEYLVMAAWLAYLKSRLLLPRPARAEADEPPAEALAEGLAFRLAKLDAMRRAGEALRRLPQFGRDVFPRGEAGGLAAAAVPFEGDLYALVAAYAEQRLRQGGRRYAPPRRIDAYPLEAARIRLGGAVPTLTDWTRLEALAPAAPRDGSGAGPTRASFLASTFAAGLELVKAGALDLRQLDAFEALWLRARRAPTGPAGAERAA